MQTPETLMSVMSSSLKKSLIDGRVLPITRGPFFLTLFNMQH